MGWFVWIIMEVRVSFLILFPQIYVILTVVRYVEQCSNYGKAWIVFLTNMQGTGSILVPAENSNLSIAQSPYLVPTYPGFANKCYISFPYSRFSTKMCCHTLGMEQIYFDRFTSFTSGLLGPIVWWSEVLCCGCTELLVARWLPQFS
jgi:hypothetical protein